MTPDEYFNEAVKTLGAYGQKATLEDVQFKIKRSQDTINELRKVGKNIDMPMLDFTTRSLSQEGIRRMALAKQVKDTTYPVLVVEDEGKNDTRFSIAADKNIDDALIGVTPDSLSNAIEDIIVNAKIDIRGTDGEKIATKIAATEFFRKYSRMKIPLSTGAFMFFAPDVRAVIRHNGDRNLAWAEYAIHQVTNNHVDSNSKKYRSYNKGKVEVVNPLLDKIVQEDNAEISDRGNVLFYSQIADDKYAVVIARPTEEGNYRADLTDVSSVLEQGKMPAKLNPLGAAIDTAVLRGVFTAESTSLATMHNVSHSDPTVNGGAKLSIRSAMPEDVVYSRNNEEGIRTLLGGPNSHEYSESLSTPKILPHSDPAINGSAKLSISPQMAERDKKAKEAIVSLGNELNTSGAGYVSDEGEIRFSIAQYNRIGREKLTAYLNNPKNNVDSQERERILTSLDGMARLMESMRGDYARFSNWQEMRRAYIQFVYK